MTAVALVLAFLVGAITGFGAFLLAIYHWRDLVLKRINEKSP